MENKLRHFLVSGKVQGVYYRAATCEKGNQLGLKGWARNLPDSRVEVLASGPEPALKAFEQWLWQGPQQARVEQVTSQRAGDDLAGSLPTDGFLIRRP